MAAVGCYWAILAPEAEPGRAVSGTVRPREISVRFIALAKRQMRVRGRRRARTGTPQCVDEGVLWCAQHFEASAGRHHLRLPCACQAMAFPTKLGCNRMALGNPYA